MKIAGWHDTFHFHLDLITLAVKTGRGERRTGREERKTEKEERKTGREERKTEVAEAENRTCGKQCLAKTCATVSDGTQPM